MTEIDFCIVVYWIHGMTVGQIHKSFGFRVGKTPGAIRGITTRLSRNRSDMTKADRQKFLNHLKLARIDDGIIPEHYFIAKPVTTDKKSGLSVAPVKVAPVEDELAKGLDLSTKSGRKTLRKRKAVLVQKNKQKHIDTRKVMEAGGAPRGTMSHPFEYLCAKGILADPSAFKKGALKQDDSATRRQEFGRMLIAIIESQYGSGMKSQSFDSSGGGGGKKVVIHARVAENASTINSLRSMMGSDIFSMMERLIIHDEFVWRVASKGAKDIALENIRMALDCVALLHFRISMTTFFERWKFRPSYDDRDPHDIRKASRKANRAISNAERSVR